MTHSKVEKLEKALGLETVQEMTSASVDELKNRIVQGEQAMVAAKAELEANMAYQELKASIKALSGGLRDLNKRQRAVIQYAIHLMESKGQ